MASSATSLRLEHAVRFDFVVPPGRWVDLDTLAEATARGLQDAGVLGAAFRGLDGLLATKRFGEHAGVSIRPVDAAALTEPPPGCAAFVATSDALPRPGDTPSKRAWRGVLDRAWAGRAPLTGGVWAAVDLGVAGSLLGPLEVVLDCLEPVLGRDPRGRSWQEFFPNDDRIEWLRVRRSGGGPPVTLRLGLVADERSS